MTNKTDSNNVLVVVDEINKNIKVLQTLTPAAANSNQERTQAVVELTIKLAAAHLIECDQQNMPKLYINLVNGHIGRIVALKSKQAMLKPFFDKAREKLLKENINSETPLSIIEVAKFITSEFDYKEVLPTTPAGPVSLEESEKLVAEAKAAKAVKKPPAAKKAVEPTNTYKLETAAIDSIDAAAGIVQDSAETLADKAADVADTIKDAVVPPEDDYVDPDAANEPPAGEHHLNLTDDTSVSVDEKTGLVYFYNEDGEVVAEGKVKRMFSRWRDTALAWLDAVWAGIKTILIAAASAISILGVGTGLGLWQVIKSPWLAWKANREIRAGEFNHDPRMAT
jgi:hypothetical protein